MKALLKASIAAIALLAGGASLAADLRGRGVLPPAPELPTFYNWTGIYLGGQVGYSWGSDRASEFATAGRAPLGPFLRLQPVLLHRRRPCRLQLPARFDRGWRRGRHRGHECC
jgi:opacity protein-like surface antigen